MASTPAGAAAWLLISPPLAPHRLIHEVIEAGRASAVHLSSPPPTNAGGTTRTSSKTGGSSSKALATRSPSSAPTVHSSSSTTPSQPSQRRAMKSIEARTAHGGFLRCALGHSVRARLKGLGLLLCDARSYSRTVRTTATAGVAEPERTACVLKPSPSLISGCRGGHRSHAGAGGPKACGHVRPRSARGSIGGRRHRGSMRRHSAPRAVVSSSQPPARFAPTIRRRHSNCWCWAEPARQLRTPRQRRSTAGGSGSLRVPNSLVENQHQPQGSAAAHGTKPACAAHCRRIVRCRLARQLLAA